MVLLQNVRLVIAKNSAAVLVGLILLVITGAVAWRVAILDERIRRQHLERISYQAAAEIEAYYNQRYAAASIARKTLQYVSSITPDRLTILSDALRHEYPEITAVNYINAERIITFISPEESNRSALGRKVGQTPDVVALLDDAQFRHLDVATRPVSLFQGNKGIVFYLPIFRADVQSGILNIVMLQPSFSASKLGIDPSTAIIVRDGVELVTQINVPGDWVDDHDSVTRHFHVLNREMSVTVSQQPDSLIMLSGFGPRMVSFVGAISSLIIALLVAQLQRQYRFAEEATHRLERFNSLSSDWLWEQDDQLRFTYVSESNVKITGLPAKVHYGRTRREVRPLDVTDEALAEHERLLDNHMPFSDFRFARINPDGRKIFLSISGEPVFSRAGRFLGYRGIGRNYTNETVLQQISELEGDVLEQAFRNVPLPEILIGLIKWLEGLNINSYVTIMLADPKGQKLVNGLGPSLPKDYMDAIDGLEIRTGNGSCGTAAATRSTVIISDLQEHEYWKPYRELASKYGLGAAWSVPILSPSGDLLGVIAVYHKNPGGTPNALELKTAENSARLAALAIERTRDHEQINLVLLAFSKVDEGLVITTASGKIVAANPAAGRLSGYAEKELIGRNVASLHLPSKEFESMLAALNEHGYWQGEITGVRKDGSHFMCRQTVTAMRDAFGKTKNYVGTYYDISEQKRRESELLDARIAADTANRAKSMFLANMSHELRTPLNAIIGLSEVIGSEALGPIGNEKYREYLNDILQSGKHLLSLINDILDLTKIVEFGAQIRRQRLVAAHVIGASLPTVRKQANDKSINLVTTIEPEDMEIFADERAIRQMLINVIGNAVKFTPQGGKIELHCRRNDKNSGTILTVRDNGPGMPATEIARIGQPFLQVRDIYTSGNSGTGLGLAITKSLVKGHGGQVAIHNHPDGGLEVVMEIPD